MCVRVQLRHRHRNNNVIWCEKLSEASTIHTQVYALLRSASALNSLPSLKHKLLRFMAA